MLANESTIPIIAPEVEILPFDDNTYLVVQNRFKHQLRISPHLHQLLSLVDGSRSIGEIAVAINRNAQIADVEKINNIFYNGRLAQCGIIQTTHPAETRTTNNYLKLRLTLLKANQIFFITRVLSILFKPSFFYTSGFAMILFIGFILVKFIFLSSNGLVIDNTVLKSSSAVLIYGILYFSTFLHEFGHASACRKFGATPGDIGFGFYLFMPVFYADVSDAWRVPARWRVVIDLAGLYMEIILCTAMCCIFLINHNILFVYLCLIILAKTYGNLNPFLRFDGYWALADALRMPNLRQQANQKLLDCWAWLVGRLPSTPLTYKGDFLLLLYAICGQLMALFFLTFLLVFNKESILHFPVNLFFFIKTVILSFEKITVTWFINKAISFIPTFLFYVLLINFLRSKFKVYYSKRKLTN